MSGERRSGRLHSSRGFSNARTIRKPVDHAFVDPGNGLVVPLLCAEAKICACDVSAATDEIYDISWRSAGFR